MMPASIHRGRSSGGLWSIWLDGSCWWRPKLLMKGCPRCMGGEGFWKITVLRIQLLPEYLLITAEMPEQHWCLLLPVLPAHCLHMRRMAEQKRRANTLTLSISWRSAYRNFALSSRQPRSRYGLPLGALGVPEDQRTWITLPIKSSLSRWQATLAAANSGWHA